MNLDGSGLTRLTYNDVFDGYYQNYIEEESASAVNSAQRKHEVRQRQMTRPTHRLSW
jgi:hypothetical protein